MLNRCRNKRNQNWANYGGRGVTVCERWMRFENFVSDMGIPEDGMTLIGSTTASATPKRTADGRRRRSRHAIGGTRAN